MIRGDARIPEWDSPTLGFRPRNQNFPTMPTAIAIIIADMEQTRLGLPSLIARMVNGRTVLAHTIARMDRVEAVKSIIVVHPRGQVITSLFDDNDYDKTVHTFAVDDGRDTYHNMRIAGRKWSLAGWRGGVGGSLIYDELLPAGPILAAAEAHHADSVLLVGGDWMLIDPELCNSVIEANLKHSENMKMVFTQAPPGLCGVALSRTLLQDMVGSSATLGNVIAYDPKRPQADPIGRDVCVQIPPSVRSCAKRFIYDTPRTGRMIDTLAAKLGDQLDDATAATITSTFNAVANNGSADAALQQFGDLPQQITLELTARRETNGPLVPQHHVNIERNDMPTNQAIAIVKQLGEQGDVALTLGGLGDPLLHSDWPAIVTAAHEAGVLGIAIDTDLLVDQNAVDQLLNLPIDVVSVRLNADCGDTYTKLMGVPRFKELTKNLEYFVNTRNRRTRSLAGVAPDSAAAEVTEVAGVTTQDMAIMPADSALASVENIITTLESTQEPKRDLPDDKSRIGLPWLVPRFAKTADNLREMESFFDRWMYYVRHAVIESPTTGGGRAPDLALVQMAPPKRFACRQLASRMTILSDGTVALCDEDWLGDAGVCNVNEVAVTDAWQSLHEPRAKHASGQWASISACAGCNQWHRP